MANSTVDFNHRRQKLYANTSAETGQSVDLTSGAGLAPKSRNVQENAGVLAASESNIKLSFANLNDTAKAPGVTTGMTGAPSIDEPASTRNMNQQLERLILELKLDNDDRQVDLAEKRIEASKAAVETKASKMEAQTAKTVQDMAEAARSAEAMKIFGWVMTGLALLAAAVTGGMAIGAAVAASGAAAAGTAAASTTAATTASTTAASTTAANTTAASTSSTAASTATSAAATTGSTAASSTGSTIGDLGISMGRTAFEKTVTTEVTKALGKEATKEMVKEAVAQRMAAATVQDFVGAAVKEGVKAGVFAGVVLGFQVGNETGAMQELAKKLSWDDAGISGQVMLMIAQIAATVGMGVTAGSSLAAGITELTSRLSASLAVVASGAQTAAHAGMSFASVGLGIRNSVKQYKAQMTQAESMEMREQLVLVRQILDENQEDLQEIINRITDTLGDAFAIIDSSNQSQKKIAEEMGTMA